MRNALLIWPPFDNPSNVPNMNFIPLGLGYIASNTGGKYDLQIKDYVLDRYSDEDLFSLIARLNPLAIGISFWEFNYSSTRYIAGRIKEYDDKQIVVLGGPSASSRENGGLKQIKADFAIKGEGELSFEMLLNFLSSGKTHDFQALDKIPGIAYFDKRTDSYRSLPIVPPDISGIKQPDYEKIRTGEYIEAKGYNYAYFSKKVRSYPINATRGCPYPCEYCSARNIHGNRIRKRKIESIMEEIAYLYNKYSIRGINIVDDNFTFDRDYLIEFCRAVISQKNNFPGLIIATPNGVRMETLDDEILDLMKQAGWESIVIAPESGSENTLKAMKKKLDINKVGFYASLVKKHKMRLFGFFIIGYPGETVEDIKKTVDFACGLAFDQIQFFSFTPLPGTPVYERLIREKSISEGSLFALYHNITYSPEGISLAQLNRLYKWALIRSLLLSPRRFIFLLKSYSFKRICKYIAAYFFKKPTPVANGIDEAAFFLQEPDVRRQPALN